MTVRRILALLFGLPGLLVGLLVLGGVISFWALGEDRDEAGFYSTQSYAFERSSRAIVSEDTQILNDAPGWLVNLLVDPVDVRIHTTSAQGSPLFVGIAATSDVERYLDGVNYDEVTDLDFDDSTLVDTEYLAHDGTVVPAAPDTQPFWEASSQSPEIRTVEWSLDSGNWTVVVMNADGSPGVNADLAFGAKVSNLNGLVWGLFGFGVFSVVGGGYLTYRGFRRPRPVAQSAVDFAVPTPPAPSRGIPPHPGAVHDPIGEPGATGSLSTGENMPSHNGSERSGKQQTAHVNSRTESFFEWVNTHVKLITIGVIVITLAAVPLAMNRSEDDPNFDPSGEIYDTLELAEDQFVSSSPFSSSMFIVEAKGDDALTRDVLREFKQNSDVARSNPDSAPDFGVQFQPSLGEEVNGVFSLADKVDEFLPAGLEGSNDADIKLALADHSGRRSGWQPAPGHPLSGCNQPHRSSRGAGGGDLGSESVYRHGGS